MRLLNQILGQGLRMAGLSAVVVVLGLIAPGRAEAEFLTGLVSGPGVGNGLIFFDSTSAGTVSPVLTITGVQNAETLVGIDYRPTTGVLYAVGNLNTLYTINTSNGVATLVASLTNIDGGAPVGLSGTFFGFDFNPVPDLAGMQSLRIVSNTGQNLRVNVNPGSAGVTNVDGTINGATPPAGGYNIVGSAYANNDVNPATGTILYGIDSNSNSLLQSTNANAGTYITLDPLGIDSSTFLGFDISGVSGTGFAAVRPDGLDSSTLYTIDLSTTSTGANRATSLGVIGLSTNFNLNGLAAQVVPEPSSLVLLGLGSLGMIGYARRRSMARAV